MPPKKQEEKTSAKKTTTPAKKTVTRKTTPKKTTEQKKTATTKKEVTKPSPKKSVVKKTTEKKSTKVVAKKTPPVKKIVTKKETIPKEEVKPIEEPSSKRGLSCKNTVRNLDSALLVGDNLYYESSFINKVAKVKFSDGTQGYLYIETQACQISLNMICVDYKELSKNELKKLDLEKFPIWEYGVKSFNKTRDLTKISKDVILENGGK